MNSETPNPEASKQPEETTESSEVVEVPSRTTVAATGKRQAFRDIRRQLSESELASPGVQKLLLEDLERAEAECDILQGYIERYHQSDKRAAVLEERLQAHLREQTAIEIFFGVGVSIGGVIIGLAPYLWDASAKGPVALGIGIALVVGSTVGRIVKR